MDMSLSKLQEKVKDRKACCAAVHRVAKNWTRLNNSNNNLRGNILFSAVVYEQGRQSPDCRYLFLQPQGSHFGMEQCGDGRVVKQGKHPDDVMAPLNSLFLESTLLLVLRWSEIINFLID